MIITFVIVCIILSVCLVCLWVLFRKLEDSRAQYNDISTEYDNAMEQLDDYEKMIAMKNQKINDLEHENKEERNLEIFWRARANANWQSGHPAKVPEVNPCVTFGSAAVAEVIEENKKNE